MQWPQHNAPTDRFFDAANACITGLFGAKPSVIPFEPGLARVATRFIGRLRAIKRHGIRFGEARNWYASAFPIREALGGREVREKRNDDEGGQKVCD